MLNAGIRVMSQWVMMALLCSLVGCNGIFDADILDEIANRIYDSVEVVQVEDPSVIILPDDADEHGNIVVIHEDVTIITVVEEQLVVEELPDITLLGFENLTGYDIFIEYYANDDLQSVFVLNGETLLLEYSCLDEIELIVEDDFDPVTGVFVDSFDLSGALFLNPDDFQCGDAFIITIDEFAVIGSPDVIELVF